MPVLGEGSLRARSQNPAQDVGGGIGQQPSLSQYYQGPGGTASIDTSGRGFFQGPGTAGPPESLAGSAAAVKAGLIGTPGPDPGAAAGAPIPGAVPPPTGLAPSGVTPPGPGQANAAQSATVPFGFFAFDFSRSITVSIAG